MKFSSPGVEEKSSGKRGWGMETRERWNSKSPAPPFSFSSVRKKFPCQSCDEVVRAADLGNSRHLQPGSTLHRESLGDNVQHRSFSHKHNMHSH